MRHIRPFILLVVFAACLAFGFSRGERTFHTLTTTGQGIPKNEVKREASLPAGQHSLLLVNVDHLDDPMPQLQSAWLAVYMDQQDHVIFVPLYPPVESSASLNGDFLKESFQLIRHKNGTQLAPAFVTALERQHLQWDGYLVLDNDALQEIHRVVNPQSPRLFQEIFFTDSFGTQQKDVQTLQANAYFSICSSISQLGSSWQMDRMFDLGFSHVSSNLNEKQLLSVFQRILSLGKGLSCEFPSIRIEAQDR